MKLFMIFAILVTCFTAQAESGSRAIQLKNSRLVFQSLQQVWPGFLERREGFAGIKVAQFQLSEIFCADTGQQTACKATAWRHGSKSVTIRANEVFLALVNEGVETNPLSSDPNYHYFKLQSLVCTRIQFLKPRPQNEEYSCQLEYPAP